MYSKNDLHCTCESVLTTASDLWNRYLDMGIRKLRGFTVLDLALFKTLLLSMGVYLGVCCANTLKKWKPLLAVLSIGLYAYFMWRFFFTDEE